MATLPVTRAIEPFLPYNVVSTRESLITVTITTLTILNCCLQNTLYINLHILFIIQFMTSKSIQEFTKIHQVHQKISTKQNYILDELVFYLYFI